MDIDFTKIAEIKQKVDKAEKNVNYLVVLAKDGKIANGLDIPSINELRYALNKILRYLTGDADGANEALKHIHRAIYDCYETESLYQTTSFSEFQSSNQDILMKDVFPRYFEIAKEFASLQEFITTTPRDNRHEYYEELEAKLQKIRPFALELQTASQEIIKARAREEKQKEEKSNALKTANENLELAHRTVRIRTIALVVALIVGLGGVAAAYFRGQLSDLSSPNSRS